MKLYYSLGACSQAAHIVLHEAELEHSSEAVDLHAKRTASGADFLEITPKDAAPALEIDNGEVLTENGAVMQYLGDYMRSDALLPRTGMPRYRVIEWLAYLGSDVHKSFGPLFNPASSDEIKQSACAMVGKKFDYMEQRLDENDYLGGETMSVADPYLFAMLGWTGKLGIDLARWPNLTAFRERMLTRPAVQTVLRAEGLLESATA